MPSQVPSADEKKHWPRVIILASANPNKAREFEKLLSGIHVQPLPAGFILPEETGTTFYDNALLKAAAVRDQFLKKGESPWVMSDDSGIEIEALGGAPGIYSSRFAGEDATDEDNVRKLLDELQGKDNRRARFVCEVVCLDPGGREIRGTGVFEGTIANEPRGKSGFGYDPLFIPLGSELTVSQIPAEEKNRISHRARAARNLLARLGGGG